MKLSHKENEDVWGTQKDISSHILRHKKIFWGLIIFHFMCRKCRDMEEIGDDMEKDTIYSHETKLNYSLEIVTKDMMFHSKNRL